MTRTSGFIPRSFSRLERLVAIECNITVEMMRERSRMQEILFARFILWYLAKQKLGYTAARIGRMTERDHTTIINGVRRVERDKDLLEQALYIATKYPDAMASRTTG